MDRSQIPVEGNGGTGRGRGGRRMAAVYVLMALVLAYTPFLLKPGTALEPGQATVVQQPDTNGCMGVRPTPGSENTDKRLVGGTLVPGGTAMFEISYPVDEKDVGRSTFVIDDCVFINDEPVAKYQVSFVPNTEFFILSFTLTIPADAPVGGEYCNYAKTTAAPSESQASNRKAGPACFVIGGDLRVLKVDQAGASLAGATFSVDCVPSSQLLPVVIEGVVRTSFAGVVDDGVITISGPQGSTCTITETAAPAGYVLASPATVVAVIGVDGPEIRFVNPRETGNLVVTKVTTGGTGTFTFTVDCDGTAYDQTLTITDSGSATVTGIPTGTSCTVTETANPLFSSVVTPGNGTVTIAAGDSTVAFTNTRLTGSLVIVKTTDGGTGTFVFTVDCDGTTYDQTVTIDGSGTVTIPGIPTGTSCTVTETPNPLCTTVVVPTTGRVTIGVGTNPVNFTNTAKPPSLQITKTADAASVTGGAPIGFTVSVVNAGAGPAVNATVSDPLPAGTGISWSISPAYPGPGTCSVTGVAPVQVLTCSLGTLAPGAGASVHVTSQTSATTSGTFVNTATARADNNPAVNATASVLVTPPAIVLSAQIEAPAPVQAVELPRTGLDVMRLVQFGLAFLGFGGLLVWAARRRQAVK